MIKVKLREKPIKKKRHSLYLDFYPAIEDPKTGKQTRRQFLGLYLIDKATNPFDKKHNKETWEIALSIRQRRDNELNKPEIYSGYEREQLNIRKKSEASFIVYFKELADKRALSNHDNWISSFHYLQKFTGGNLKFVDLDLKFCNDFREFLLKTPSQRTGKTKLSQNSAVSYFNKLKATLRQAYKDGYLQTDLNNSVQAIKQAETHRNFLTIEELNQLAKTEWNNPVLKNAALFAAMTGLRFSDVKKLVWSELIYSKKEGYSIQYRQQKTKGAEILPINEQAFSFLGERKGPNEKVFESLTDRDRYYYFPLWVAKAGIKKEITFHCLRHTYATLQIGEGTPIFTVMNMLGHKHVKTTQVYAKIMDKSKREAANRITLKL